MAMHDQTALVHMVVIVLALVVCIWYKDLFFNNTRLIYLLDTSLMVPSGAMFANKVWPICQNC